jgi:hypothetical protein
MRVWIDGDIKIGTFGYLVESVATGESSWSLHDRPVKGWRGVGKVVRRNKAGDRAQILLLQGRERDAFLRRDANPDLVVPRRAVERAGAPTRKRARATRLELPSSCGR